MIGAIPKGLFGRGMRGVIGGASLQRPMEQPEPEQPKSFWQGGGKFTGKDAIAGALAAIGDGLSNWSNGGGNTATGALLDSRMRPELERQRMAREAAKQAQEIAAYRTKKGIDAEFTQPDKAKPGSFEWYQTATPNERALYDQFDPVTVATWQGPVVMPRRPAVGAVVKMSDLSPATIDNTPAPKVGSNGLPSALTPAQYQATVASMGKAKTDEWMQRNNIRIGN